MEIKKYAVGKTVAEAFGIALPCGGKGKCGGCKVEVRGQLSPPDGTEAALLKGCPEGTRLACRALCMGKVTVTLPDDTITAITDTFDSYPTLAPLSEGNTGAAIDIGTTTIAAKLIDSTTGKVLAQAVMPNPQSRFGADVTSRMESAINGAGEELRAIITSAVLEILQKLTDAPVHTTVVVGNTTMLHLLAGEDLSGMATAPFTPANRFGQFYSAADLVGKCSHGRFYLGPCVSAFVGADTTAAVVACSGNTKGSILICDIGTNGELALVKNGKVTCTSTAAGPALEGAEISCGMTAKSGAIESVKAVNGVLTVKTVGNTPAEGICGSGLISAAAALLDAGILSPDGYLPEPVELAKGVTLLPSDIRKLQTAKAAIRAGIEVLTEGEIPDRVIIAGGFGHYLDTEDCIRIGLLPEWVRGKTVSVGNAALTGACMMLQNSSLTETAKTVAKAAKLTELDLSERFSELYIENMKF